MASAMLSLQVPGIASQSDDDAAAITGCRRPLLANDACGLPSAEQLAHRCCGQYWPRLLRTVPALTMLGFDMRHAAGGRQRGGRLVSK